MSEKAKKGCEVLLLTCAEAKPGEKVLVITDDKSFAIGNIMYDCAKAYTDTTLICTEPRATHGSAPTDAVAAAMKSADVIFSATTFSLFNTTARIEACKAGARFVNMADYSVAMLEAGCLFVDFARTRSLVEATAARITGKVCTITTPAGTNLTASIEGRKAVSGFGMANKPGMAASPPDIETAVGPTDGGADGVLVIDGSIPLPGLGVLKEPVRIRVEKGCIADIAGGAEAKLLDESLKAMNDPRVYRVGEIGFGMNTGAGISGRMLEDEGVYGTLHIGIGNNLSYGGTNDTPIHIDLIMKSPTYTVDGRVVCKDGEYTDSE
ncbi:MAG: aminopeptidase [Deltaproteobacteria bacterium]|nr:aminopeptidase [Deltaproteobacteria bacterium]